MKFDRTSAQGLSESYEADAASGVTIVKGLDGNEITTSRFVSGPLTGRIRKMEQESNGSPITLYSASYFPSGILMREAFYPNKVRSYSETGKLLKEMVGNTVTYEQDYDAEGHLIHILNPAKQIEVKRSYDSQGVQTTHVYKNGALFYTEKIDTNNNLISFDKGTP